VLPLESSYSLVVWALHGHLEDAIFVAGFDHVGVNPSGHRARELAIREFSVEIVLLFFLLFLLAFSFDGIN
jgi:hypothetical protein